MPKYMMLLHESTTGFAHLGPAEIQAIIQQYKAWRDKVGAAGKLVGGEKLRDEGGRHLAMRGGKVSVRDGPFAEVKEVIGGYFIIAASDYADAVNVAEGCPHLALGGRIELREIEPT